jgi:hypothetical protein
MNKTLLSALIFASAILNLKAQIYTSDCTIESNVENNSIGIGTITPPLNIQALTSGGNNSVTPLISLQDDRSDRYSSINIVRGDGSYDLGMSFSTVYETGGSPFISEKMRINPDGKIGIGTLTPPLQTSIQALRSGGNNSVTPLISLQDDRSDRYSSINIVRGVGSYDLGMSFSTVYQTGGSSIISEKIRINPDGKIGIGTMNPTAKLETYNGTSGITSFKTIGVNGHLFIDNEGSGENYYDASNFQEFQMGGLPKMRINANGNVGIGTVSPDEKLTVNGNIHAKEIRIDTSISVPDYVFANDYKLNTLQEIEAYIKQNSHLPEIPSAKEIEKNGLMLAEMNMAILKKVEEMTLYIIEQNKRIEKLEKENNKK